MKSIAFLMCAGVLLIGLPTNAHADEASKSAKIEEMFRLSRADQIIQQIMAQIQPMMRQQLSKVEVPPEGRAAMEEMQQKMTSLIAGMLTWEKLKPLYVKIYSESFSEDDLDGIIGFYKTPAGQALLQKMPVLMQKSMAATQEIMADFIPEITKMTEEMQRKYGKK